MTRVRRLGMAALLLVVSAGCQTASPPSPLTAVIVPERLEIAPPAPLVAPLPLATSSPPATVFRQRAPWPTNWVNAWVPLESWGKFNGLPQPVQLASNPQPIFEFHTSNGVMAIKMGSRITHCQGLECWLGYAPQLIKGTPYIHSLDAQKSLQPLVSPRAYHFTTQRTIVIDPGHGGKDSGATNVHHKSFEKDYTLDWAMRLRRLLATNGWRVVLTRSNDADVSLADRVALAERADADLFLSLHFNSAIANRELTGLETYCLTPTGLPSNLVRTYEDDLRQVYPNNAFDEQNFQLAFLLHKTLLQCLELTDRGLRRARFMAVLRGQNRPAVLIEGGYLSNAKEARKIDTPEYRQKLAEAVAQGLDLSRGANDS